MTQGETPCHSVPGDELPDELVTNAQEPDGRFLKEADFPER